MRLDIPWCDVKLFTLMKRLLNAYYERTVIPAIILTCLSGLLLDGASFATSEILSVTFSDVIGIFILFLSVMSVEDVYALYKGTYFSATPTT